MLSTKHGGEFEPRSLGSPHWTHFELSAYWFEESFQRVRLPG
jgi:hypothetical protein